MNTNYASSPTALSIIALKNVLPDRLCDLPAEQLVDHAQRLGFALSTIIGDRQTDVGNNQIRTILDEFVRVRVILQGPGIEGIDERLQLIRPRLAYAASRIERDRHTHESRNARDVFRAFVDYLDKAIVSAAGPATENDKERGVEKLTDLVQAIVSYLYFARAAKSDRT
jgi:CRISPR type III-A-associated protein Csm2